MVYIEYQYVWTITLNEMTFDVDIWHAGLP